jgi:exopolysaccharide biosynthesis polyprenyl glycosylphosphotransferase
MRLNLVGDVLILTAASLAGATEDGLVHWRVALAMAVIAAALWVLVSRVLRHYDVWNGRDFFHDLALTLVLVGAVVVPMALLRLVSPRYAVTTELARFLAVLLPAVIWLRVRTVGARLWSERPIAQMLVVGAGPLGRITHRQLTDGGKRCTVIGYLGFDGEVGNARLGAPVLGAVGEIDRVLRERVVDEVYFASLDFAHAGAIQSAIGVCERFGVPFAAPVSGYRLGRAKPACENAVRDGYVHFLSVPYKPLQVALKRVLDILASGVALVLLSPLLVAAALLVKLTSRGPVLFRQERVGLYGRTFHMLKFRSMVDGAERAKALLLAQNEQSGPVFKMAHDPRITRVGRFIRKYSIDELPQLVNVLRGDMSLVGPRPPLPSEVARYEAWQRRRLSMRPGLTCVWQVSGRNQIGFEEWMLLDMRYIDHWSLVHDVRLILKTIPIVVTGRGAS